MTSPNICRVTCLRARVFGTILVCAIGLSGALLAVGCNGNKARKKELSLAPRYQALPPREVPAYLKGTILESCDLLNNTPAAISGFGLVANLRGTGDTFVGNAVRQYILTTMIKRGFGSRQMGFENMQPEEVLRDPRFAIVRVDGLLPPGVRRMQRFDVFISTLDGNNTTSLAHGDLYRSDLKVDGANVQMPGHSIDIWATGEGSIFVNPVYAMETNPTSPEARNSLRQGVIPGGGVAMMDRPLVLRLRQPQLAAARFIQFRIGQAFQSNATAAAKDEALIAIYVPEKFGADWEHFSQVVRHLYLDSRPEFVVVKARQLAEEAVKPDAPLLDISYCWEAMGPSALPFVTPLMTSDKPEVAFAAARAAAFIGDGSAQSVLMQMARTTGHAFQLAAVQTLAKMPATPEINQLLRGLLDVNESLVRVEAYRALAANGDSSIISRPVVRPTGDPSFMLDIVPSQGPPLIWASRSGIPRIAVFGNKPRMSLSGVFSAMDNRLTISAVQERDLLNIFYRGPELKDPVSVLSSPDLTELIGRLGGQGAPGDSRLNFDYCEVVSLLQAMTDQHRLAAASSSLGGKRDLVAFVLQEAPRVQREIESAPMIPEIQSQQAPAVPDAPEKYGPAADATSKNK